jgi:excisionase family DNA binding protein
MFKPPAIRLVSIQTAAVILNCGRSTIYKLMDAGALPSIKVGRSRKLTMEGIDSYIANRLAENGKPTFAAAPAATTGSTQALQIVVERNDLAASPGKGGGQ